jgi:cephalosporin hydroxylase
MKSTILSEFDQHDGFKRLARRRENFRTMVAHVLDFSAVHVGCSIIETGSAHDTDNWEGQGQSTLIWDWLMSKQVLVSALSIDITPKSVETAASQCPAVKFICGDSVKSLNDLDSSVFKKVGLLYLDSFDWSPAQNLESSFHHMAELATCWRLLPSGCMVVVDDRHGDEEGKHWLVEAFMSHYLKLKPVFRNHQIGWIKP